MKLRDYGDRIELVSNKEYRFHAIGDYSDCGKFEEIA